MDAFEKINKMKAFCISSLIFVLFYNMLCLEPVLW